MRPLHNKIFAEILPPPKTAAGIILPGDDKLNNMAKVLEVGPKVKYAKKGMTMNFNQHTVQHYEENGKQYVFAREDADVIYFLPLDQ
jgi:co-chaperonin GroES (HSP10)